MKKGKFIIIEGPDGSGKSTVHGAVVHHLMSRGVTPVAVRDPGSTEIGNDLRKVLLNSAYDNMCPTTELFLYVASRAQLVHELIKPHLDKGETVVSDRFTLSTLVYQGLFGWPDEVLSSTVKFGLQDVYPDLVVLLDVSAETAIERLKDKTPDRVEQRGIEFFRAVRERYLIVARESFKSVLKVIDAEKDIEIVKKEVFMIIDESCAKDETIVI